MDVSSRMVMLGLCEEMVNGKEPVCGSEPADAYDRGLLWKVLRDRNAKNQLAASERSGTKIAFVEIGR